MSETSREYRIVPLDEEWFEQTAKLLSIMWHLPLSKSKLRLRWKYFDCPLTKIPLVYLAICDCQVVATLGFFPSPFRIGKQRVIVFCPGDGFVEEAHRRYGLYTRLLIKGHEELNNYSNLFISLSANQKSAAGLLKIDWRTLAPRKSLWRIQKLPTIRYFLKSSSSRCLDSDLVVDAGTIADFYQGIPLEPGSDSKRIIPDPDRAYILWRYANPTEQYFATPWYQDNKIMAFAVCMVNNRDVFVLDYRECQNSNAFVHVVEILRKKITIPRIIWARNVLSQHQQKILQRSGFYDYRPILNIFMDRPSVPILIHPTKRLTIEKDWIINGAKIDELKNWIIPEYCNDGY